MTNQKLNPKILSKLKKKFPKKTENALYVKLSKLSSKNNVTLNAAGEIWGKKDGFTVRSYLDEKDRDSLKDKSFQVIKIKKNNNHGNLKKRIVDFVSFSTQNKFLKAHIDEINRAYSSGCYTASFILIRKVIENLIVEMIKKKFPGKTKEDKALYLDIDRNRIQDLSVLIKNFRSKLKSFDADESKLIERILQKADEFKDDANDKTHSLYHISSKKELEDKAPQMTFDLIAEFFSKY
ncbi:MAG: hypothetical protein AABW71_05140 [Nanoarchaeota archaeon]